MKSFLNLDVMKIIDPNVYQVTYKGRVWNSRKTKGKGVVQFRYTDGNFTATFYTDCFGLSCVYFDLA